MTTHYLYLGTYACGWLDIKSNDKLHTDLLQSPGESLLNLRNPTVNEQLASVSQKEQFINNALGHSTNSDKVSIVLIIDNGAESVEWHRTLVESKKSNDEDALHVVSVYGASALRKKYCMCPADFASPTMNGLPGSFVGSGSVLSRRIEYMQYQDCLAWYRVVKQCAGNYPMMLSFSLLIESVVQKSCEWTHGMLIIDNGLGYERHLYFRSGLVCFSRWIKSPDNDSIEEVGDLVDNSIRSNTSRKTVFTIQNELSTVQAETKTYLLQHFPIPTDCTCVDPECSEETEKTAFPCYRLSLHTNDSIAGLSFRQALVKSLASLEKTGIQAFLSKSRTSVEKFRLHNTETLFNHDKKVRTECYQYIQYTALVSLVGLLCWHVSALAITHQKINQIDDVIEKQTEILHRNNQIQPGEYSTAPNVMQWLVESQIRIGQQSIVMPLAVLSRLQNVIHSLPAVALTGIEWHSDGQDLLVSTVPSNAPSTLRLVLNGVIGETVVDNTSEIDNVGEVDNTDEVDSVQGLHQFELFLTSLNNAFGVTQPDRIRYPFGADTNDRIRQSGLHSESTPASNSFSIEISIPQQHLQQEISSLDALLGDPGR